MGSMNPNPDPKSEKVMDVKKTRVTGFKSGTWRRTIKVNEFAKMLIMRMTPVAVALNMRSAGVALECGTDVASEYVVVPVMSKTSDDVASEREVVVKFRDTMSTKSAFYWLTCVYNVQKLRSFKSCVTLQKVY